MSPAARIKLVTWGGDAEVGAPGAGEARGEPMQSSPAYLAGALLLVCFGTHPACCTAQAFHAPEVVGSGGGGGGFGVVREPTEQEIREMAIARRDVIKIERELKKIRATYFQNIRNVEIRQAGIAQLRKFTDPAIFPSLLEVFEREGEDVRTAIVEHLASLETDEADTTLAWTAVFDKDQVVRDAAERCLVARAEESGGSTNRIKAVLAAGLQSEKQTEISRSANIIKALKIYDAIPALIHAQVGPTGTTGGDRTGSLGWILIGTQRSIVSDLTPVVADSAVAFDPTLSVITEGTYLRVLDAVVVQYNADVHNALVGMTSDRWGQSTAHLGYDTRKWWEWYKRDFTPMLGQSEPAAPMSAVTQAIAANAGSDASFRPSRSAIPPVPGLTPGR